MKFMDMEQGSPEWHELRRTKIGASNSPALLGLSPYKTASDVFKEMVLGEVGYTNKAMAHGSNTEREARDYFNKINPSQGPEFSFKPVVVVSEEYDLMMASLDGINGSNSVILEIKVPGDKVYELCVQERVPIHWEYQIQHQLAVTGLDLAILFVYQDPINNLIFRYVRDEKKIAEIVAACQEFEEKHLLTFECPDLKSNCYAIREDDEWKKKVEGYLSAKKNREAAEVLEKWYYAELLKESDHMPSKGFGIRVDRSERKGQVDYSLVEELKGISLDQYRKPTTIQWRICEIKY